MYNTCMIGIVPVSRDRFHTVFCVVCCRTLYIYHKPHTYKYNHKHSDLKVRASLTCTGVLGRCYSLLMARTSCVCWQRHIHKVNFCFYFVWQLYGVKLTIIFIWKRKMQNKTCHKTWHVQIPSTLTKYFYLSCKWW